MTWRIIILIGLMMLTWTNWGLAEDCAEARRLARQAYDLGSAPGVRPVKQDLLTRALELCPAFSEAHNNLADLLEQAQAQAQAHYRAAVRLNPQLTDAWMSLGQIASQQGQLPVALDADLHACPQRADARQPIAELLTDARYQVAPDGTIFEKDSLLLLFDRARRADMQQMLADCQFRSGDDFGSRGVTVEATAEFPNILFDLGQATLRPESLAQIRELGAALQEFGGDVQIVIAGHTDKQGFQDVTEPAENLRRNMQLSADRAATVACELTQLGIPAARIATQGYGPTRPAIDADTPEAYARNRRVEITVH